MAIKASATVTISCYRDTQSVTRYYKLQSSTIAVPEKPTANPPSGWTDAEPSYTSGSTNTLYFCDLSVFSDGTWSYSTVSKSSSYEAAKEAYNKAVAAQNTANDAQSDAENAQAAADQAQASVSDVGGRMDTVQVELDSVKKTISHLVEDENGNSLMKQTSEGFVFCIGDMPARIDQSAEQIMNLQIEVGDLKNNELASLMAAVGKMTAYVRIVEHDNVPYLELGNDTEFKVQITNSAINFMEGSSVPASISNQRLIIGAATVDDTLQFGDFVFAERSNGNMGLMWRGA